MSKWYKRFLNAVLVFTLVFAFNIIAFAQGTTKIAVSKSSAAVGDKITVSVSGTEKGTITVKFTSSMLNLTSCNVSGYSTEGNSVSFSGTSGDLVFNAVSEGTASIIVSSSANSGSSTTLSIGGSSSATSEPAAEPEQAEPEAPAEEEPAEQPAEPAAPVAVPADGSVGTLNGDGGFDINGVSYVVSERYSDSEIPSGFSKTTITIGSSTYSELTNGSITLVYLKSADNTAGSGAFYLYNADAGTVSPFLMLGSAKNYVIISTPDAPISSSFTETSLEVTGGTAIAYTLDGAEFFYVYGVNQDGAAGWYLYDKTYGTISRVDESALSASADAGNDEDIVNNSDDTEVYIEKLNLYRKIIMGLIIFCVILLFIIINKALKGRGEDDDFDGDVFAEAPKKNAKRLPRSIVFGSRNQDEDDEDYDDEDEESEEDGDYEEDIDEEEYYDEDEEEYYDEPETSRARYESESYEARRDSSLNMMDLNDL
ncbi:hypothetical protein [Pseudobutyrivibrio ruminis]|uniref:hypothetical protein n=1 Tax=Pseudobutyrivibrio ruminis TaxID=46206 RepID=UPI000417FB48|nr:hypothetical protein [Pseudobutyrivibrio ruminis]